MTTLPGFASVASSQTIDHESTYRYSATDLTDGAPACSNSSRDGSNFSVAQRESWQHKQVQRHRAQQASEDNDRHGTLDLASGIAHADCERQHAEGGHDRGHENRTKPICGSSDCSIQPPGHVLNFDEMLVVGDHENRITECDAEESDEAHHAAQGQLSTGREHGEYAAHQGEWQVRKNQGEIAPVAGHDREQQDDAGACDERVDDEVASCLRLCLSRARKLEVGPSRKLHLGSDFRLCRLDEGGNIAAGNIRGHRLDALSPFVHHLVTPSGLVNIGDLSQENESAALAAKGQASYFCNVVSAGAIEDRNDIEDLVTLIRLSDNLALIGRADQLEHLDSIEAPALKVGFAQADDELR